MIEVIFNYLPTIIFVAVLGAIVAIGYEYLKQRTVQTKTQRKINQEVNRLLREEIARKKVKSKEARLEYQKWKKAYQEKYGRNPDPGSDGNNAS